jgi:Mn2+/Fe2+ NRAMP family transporter
MLGLFIANLGTAVANFAGLAAGAEILGIKKYLLLPVVAVSIWLLVTKGSYMTIERILLGACFIYIGYVIAAFMAKPDWSQAIRGTFVPTIRWDYEFIVLAIAIIGTTITPWMQFYLQSSIADKGVKIENYNATKADVVIGSLTTDTVSFFIMLTCAATLFVHGIRIEEASEAAIALRPLAGEYASLLFAVSLGNASLLGAIVVPLTTAYVICEGMGWESGLNKTFKEAPQFLGIYTIIVVIAGILVLIPGAPLVSLMVLASFINGLLLPFVLLYVISLANNKQIMGSYVISKGYNYIAWGTVIVIICLTAFLVVTTIIPSGGKV